MAFLNNVPDFMNALGNDLHNIIKSAPDLNGDCFSNIKNISATVIKSAKHCSKKFISHYPTTFVILLVAQTIIFGLIPSFSQLIMIYLNWSTAIYYRNHIYTAVNIHDIRNINELTASYEEKESLTKIINIGANSINLIEFIGNIFGNPFR